MRKRRSLTLEQLEHRCLLAQLPPGFTETVIADGIFNPTAMEIAPDGRIFVAEQAGRLRVIQNGTLLPDPFLNLNVNSAGERGLLGVAFDPNFTTNQFLYVYYTTAGAPIHNRVSRFTANGNVVQPNSELVLIDLNNLSSATNHNGGAIHFGPDGKLYVGVGDNANGAHSQTLGNLLGKMLRINTDPANLIPNDNPFMNTANGINRAIWALGMRNPFTFAIQPGTGRVFINDVGQVSWEEINDGIAGSNYGWPNSEGRRQQGDPATNIGTYRDPVLQYGHGNSNSTGCAITGGTFYNPDAPQFPDSFVGDYFFADLCSGWIRRIDPITGSATGFATELPFAPVDLKVDAAGNLYYLTRGFGNDTGMVTRVQFPAAQNAPSITQHPSDQNVSTCESAEFRVAASGSAPLRFQWQRDRSDIPGATNATLVVDNPNESDHGARFRAVVSNDFGSDTSNEATLNVSANQSPSAAIDLPAAGTRYNAGDTIQFAGSAIDPEDGTLSGNSFTWEVVFHHDTHTHPFIQPFQGVTGGSFVIPTVGETATNVFYRIHLTAIDSNGCTHSTSRDLVPNTSMITLETDPPGLQVRLDDQPVTAPISVASVVGMTRRLGFVVPQQMDGTHYAFSTWSDGGTARHDITTPATDRAYVATHAAIGHPAVTDLRVAGNGKNARQVVLSFSNPLDPTTAGEAANYQIVSPGKDGRFGSAARGARDDKVIQIEAPVYQMSVDPATAEITTTVTLTAAAALKGSFHRLRLDGTAAPANPNALRGINGGLLDGEFGNGFASGDGNPGGDFVALFGFGRKLSYADRDGDRVSLELKGPGLMELTREAPGDDGVRAEGMTLRLTQTQRTSSLTGKLKTAAPGHRTSFASVAGLAGLRNNIEDNAAFQIGRLAAELVDRLLEYGRPI